MFFLFSCSHWIPLKWYHDTGAFWRLIGERKQDMNKVFICRRLIFGTWTASMALLTLYCSQAQIHMACACVWGLVTWLLVEKIVYPPKVGHGRLVLTRFVLLQFFGEASFTWSHFLCYSASWKPAIIWEIWWELLGVYVSQIHNLIVFLLGRTKVKGISGCGPLSDFSALSTPLLAKWREYSVVPQQGELCILR